MEGKEFDEAQFEAYRQLGLRTIGEALPNEPELFTAADWIQHLRALDSNRTPTSRPQPPAD
jgi:hypothetical protein